MPLSLYVHIPFCQRKCPYCDFNTYAGLNRLFEPLATALVREIEAAGAARGRPAVKTIFLGGGTPTVLPARLLASILAACRHAFDVQPDAEITSEANPGTVDVLRFAALRELGVNRLSMGVQSFDPAELDFLGRIHTAADAVAAFHAARAAGFDNVNLDFIYGLPNQSPATWRRTLEQALALAPEHLSLYSLTIEEGTPFGEWAAAGRLAQPDPDLAADLYEMATQRMANAGYGQYEISNWAKPETVASEQWPVNSEERRTGWSINPPAALAYQSTDLPVDNPAFACRHNLTYWRNEEYLGFGPGAHSSEKGRRWANVRPVAEYIAATARIQVAPSTDGSRPAPDIPLIDFQETIDDRLAMGETMMLGLRLVREGVTFERFAQRHGQTMSAVFGAEIDRLERYGLLERLPDRLRLTRRAWLVGNRVFGAFLP